MPPQQQNINARPGVNTRVLEIVDVEPLRAEIEAFIDAAQNNLPSPVSGLEGRRALATALSALKKSKNTRRAQDYTCSASKSDERSATKSNRSAVDEAHRGRRFPSAVYLVGERGRVCFEGALGDAVREPTARHAALDTIYDLASLTKPLITGLLCARRIEQGELSLDDSIARYLPEFDTPEKRTINVRQLLTHTSGLPAWLPLALITNGERSRALDAIASQLLEAAPGTRVRYSDLGFITLGILLEN
jgi:CubicO group peptidase (beta-lactamase class C family)